MHFYTGVVKVVGSSSVLWVHTPATGKCNSNAEGSCVLAHGLTWAEKCSRHAHVIELEVRNSCHRTCSCLQNRSPAGTADFKMETKIWEIINPHSVKPSLNPPKYTLSTNVSVLLPAVQIRCDLQELESHKKEQVSFSHK